MGLVIYSSDDIIEFHIGYVGFSLIRTYFVLHYGKEAYDDYMKILRWTLCLSGDPCPVDVDEFERKVGDLTILLTHSDCDGELSSDECKRLRECLFVDEDRIRELHPNPEVTDMRIRTMHEFIKVIEYCADRDDVKLLFG